MKKNDNKTNNRVKTIVFVAFAAGLLSGINAEDAHQTPPQIENNEHTVTDSFNQFVLCSNVIKREPQDIQDSFDTGKVYAFINLKKPKTSFVIFVWKHGKTHHRNIKLPVTSESFRWRTWSWINVDQEGSWTVQILDDQEKVLGEKTFHVPKDRHSIPIEEDHVDEPVKPVSNDTVFDQQQNNSVSHMLQSLQPEKK